MLRWTEHDLYGYGDVKGNKEQIVHMKICDGCVDKLRREAFKEGLSSEKVKGGMVLRKPEEVSMEECLDDLKELQQK